MHRIFLPKVAILLALFAFHAPTNLAAQHNHAQMTAAPRVMQEPGQGAFAAVTEIVTLLREDPDTEWQKVDIGALRQHLVDMSELMLISEVTQTPIKEGLRIAIDLTKPENAAASRMVPAHGPVLASETGWLSMVSQKEATIIWEVTSPSDVDMIQALGFYGLMSTGDHHKAHHMALARGSKGH
ncbi:MAG: hypothetical protein WA790_11460 [Sulfitobacter sp.]